jgi:CHRD domain
MLRTNKRSIATAALFTLTLALTVAAQSGNRKGHADLVGYQENPTLSSPATGTLDVEISKDGESLDYTLSYSDFPTDVRFAHIHIGRPAINGGVMVFLCSNEGAPATVPAPPLCPKRSGTVTGTLAAANVLAVTSQGIAAGEFSEVVQALQAEAAYGNVHSVQFGGGEIRGQVTFHRADSINDN